MKKIIKVLFATILLLSIVSCGEPQGFSNVDSMLNYKSGVDVKRFTYDNVNDVIEGVEKLKYGSDITFIPASVFGPYFMYGNGMYEAEAVNGVYVVKFNKGNYRVARFNNGTMQEYVRLNAHRVPTYIGFGGYKGQEGVWEIPLNNN